MLELVVDGAGSLLFPLTEERRELEQIAPFNLFQVEFVTGLQEVGEGGVIRRVASRLVAIRLLVDVSSTR